MSSSKKRARLDLVSAALIIIVVIGLALRLPASFKYVFMDEGPVLLNVLEFRKLYSDLKQNPGKFPWKKVKLFEQGSGPAVTVYKKIGSR